MTTTLEHPQESRETGGSAVIAGILAYLQDRRLQPGDRLPSERDLAERLGVGRNAVREALATLVTLRMVESRPNSGIYLRHVARESSFEALVMLTDMGGTPTPTEVAETMGTVRLEIERTDVNVIDAAGRGTSEGLALALNVGAMLISFMALIALLNALLGLVGLSLQQIFGWVFAPIAWSMGVPWRDAPTIGNLLGTRMASNEFIAYSQLGPMKPMLDPRSFTIATFALCGFANFSSIGIQIGGIGALAPTRRHDLARLGLRAMLAGTLANFITATIAGFLL